ncbi:hypothetical protein V496_00686 [Pseudogymnoascus sp. VKM F-4515 (FW-2607)]|nr:hypothetical protein V496_00686 [Pseudogymnoascus sp. VKM F-4515 (FW-2607)]
MHHNFGSTNYYDNEQADIYNLSNDNHYSAALLIHLIDRIYSGCETYYQAVAGDNCTSITDYFFGFNEAQFISRNPAVFYDCSNLVIGNYYCVQAQAYQPSPAVFSGPSLPSPLPNCTVSDCIAWYRATETDNCTSVPQTFGSFSLVEFTQWNSINPANCTGFDTGYFYCIN